MCRAVHVIPLRGTKWEGSYLGAVPGLGSYFLDSPVSDIDSLAFYTGIHGKVFGSHRALSKRFPFAIYCDLAGDEVQIHAVLDCRRRPSWIRRRLKRS